MKALRVLPLLAVVIVACSESPMVVDPGTSDAGTAGGMDAAVPQGDPFDTTTRASAYAAAACAFEAQCQPLELAFVGQTEAQCVAAVTTNISRFWNQLVPLITAQRVTFSATAFDRCIAAFATARSDCALGLEPAACEDLFSGARTTGQACGASEECATGLWCRITGTGSCGVCEARGASQSNCENNVCGSALTCVDANNSIICVPETASVGQTCFTLQTGVCRGDLQCVGPENGPLVCARPAGSSMACVTNGTAADCSISAGFACVNGTCQAAQVVAAPSACGMAAPANECNSASTCDTALQRCRAFPTIGQTCTASVACADGGYCAATSAMAVRGTCTAQGGPQAQCQASVQCREDLVCVSGTCQTPTLNAACN